MNYDEARRRLLNHANLAWLAGDANDEESILYLLWNFERTGRTREITPFCDDIVACLDVINHALNGSTPSQSIDKEQKIDRQIVLAVNSILHSGWEVVARTKPDRANFGRELAEILLTVSLAWLAVVDGDIDSISEHIEHERTGKNRDGTRKGDK